MLALLASIASVLLVAEIGARVFFRDEIDSELLRERNRRLHIGHLIEPADDPELLYELRTGLSAEWKGILVETSETEPRRVSTFMPAPEDPAIRIALIGDSSAFGWGIEYESTYGEITRRKLEHTLGTPVELRNYAVPGYQTLQERIRFEENIVAWRPDILLLHYDHNDVTNVNTAPPEYIAPEYGDNLLRSGLVKFVLRRIRAIAVGNSVHFSADQDPTRRHLNGAVYAGEHWERHARELDRIGKVALENGIFPVACLWCYNVGNTISRRDERHFEIVHPPLLKRLEEAGFAVLDLFPLLEERMKAAGWTSLGPIIFSESDYHPNRDGHAFIADHLHRFLAETPAARERMTAAVERWRASSPASRTSGIGDEFRNAIAMAGSGKLPEAEILFRGLVSAKPGSADIRVRLMQVLLMQGKEDEAGEELEAIAQIKPDYVQPLLNIGAYYATKRDYDRAIHYFQSAVERAASLYVKTYAIKELADALFSAGRVSEAERRFYELRELVGEHDAAPIVLLAGRHLSAANYGEARKHLEVALEVEPSNEDARSALARILEIEHRAAEALAILDSLVGEHPKNVDYLTRTAVLLATSQDEAVHDVARAVALAEEACRLSNGREPRALMALALAQADAGEFAKAVESVNKAIDLYAAAGNAAAAESATAYRAGFERGNKVRTRAPNP